MKSQAELRKLLREIDHKGYKAYKVLEGEYDFGVYHLAIDHVQGDPFATPSRVRVIYNNRGNIAPGYFEEKHRRIAAEDYLLRRVHRNLNADYAHSDALCAGRGSKNNGIVTTCRVGQEVLERTAMHITRDVIEARIEVGFPAFGRTIAADELAGILFDFIPQLAENSLRFTPVMKRGLDACVELADDQQYIRDVLDDMGLAAFIADGSVLPRESGISQKPMKDAVVFKSPESLAVTLKLPHRGDVRGMGIKKGVTVITGGGFHGKSTLLEALERGVYSHVAGDGRELVITEQSAFKLRAEEGRCIHETDISMFINNLPVPHTEKLKADVSAAALGHRSGDTTCFSTENASGSTSQAANTVEALASDCKLFLIDEDTSATNFMVRDALMAQLVPDEKEPITPFIRKIRSLYSNLGVSTVLVVGSSGDYLAVADTVLQMDCYEAKDVTAAAEKLCRSIQKENEEHVKYTDWVKKSVRTKQVEKVRVHGWDTVSLDREDIDLRYLEQIVDESQSAALAYLMQYILGRMADGHKTASDLAKEAAQKIEKEGILSITPKNYGAGAASAVRRQEILACLTRYRKL